MSKDTQRTDVPLWDTRQEPSRLRRNRYGGGYEVLRACGAEPVLP